MRNETICLCFPYVQSQLEIKQHSLQVTAKYRLYKDNRDLGDLWNFWSLPKSIYTVCFFFILKSHDQCYQNKELRLWFEDITILYFVGTWNPQKVRIQNSTYRELQFQLDPSSFETWHGMYTIALESEDEVGIPGIFKVKKTDNFSGSLDSWAGWPYPYWQVLENSSYAARAKELQGMMLKTKGAEAPFHQWNLGKIHGISWKSMGMFGFLGSWRFEVFQISSWKYQFSGLGNDSKSQNEGRIKKYIDSCFHLF